MILQALARYCECLRAQCPGAVCELGWEKRKVAGVLEIGRDGRPVSWAETPGCEMEAPSYKTGRRGNRVDGIAYCDTPAYLLGVSDKNPERALECFAASRDFHLGLLRATSSPQADAVRAYFEEWAPGKAQEDPVVGPALDGIRKAAGNVMLAYDGRPIVSFPDLRAAWNEAYDRCVAEGLGGRDAVSLGEGVDLVTGKRAPIARVHPLVKGFGQSSGVALVSFNKRSFESWGQERGQGANAPTSVRSANAYTAALQHLFKSPVHNVRIGSDLIYVFWAERDDVAASSIFGRAIGGRAQDSSDAEELEGRLGRAMRCVRDGVPCEDVDLEAPFCVLGLKAYAGRLAPVAFEQGTLAGLLGKVGRHRERLIPDRDGGHASPWRLVQAVRNPHVKTWSAGDTRLHAALVKAVLEDGVYPPALYQRMLARVLAARESPKRKTAKVTRDCASIARMHLVRNCGMGLEELNMDDPNACLEQAWTFGRYLAVLEAMQYAAHGKRVNSTVGDRFFNEASRTPQRAFPTMESYVLHWSRKLERRGKEGIAVGYRRKLEELRDGFGLLPRQFDARERGLFMLGYYAERKKHFDEIAAAKQGREDGGQSDGELGAEGAVA